MNARELPARLGGLEPTLPSSWYRSAEVFALEKERIFCREWLCVAREEELAATGSVPPARCAGRKHPAGAQP